MDVVTQRKLTGALWDMMDGLYEKLDRDEYYDFIAIDTRLIELDASVEWDIEQIHEVEVGNVV